MALPKAGDRAAETSTTTGVGPFSLVGAMTDWRTIVAACGTGATVDYYAVQEDGSAGYEVGRGVITGGTPDTLTRVTVFASSNSDALVSWGVGTRKVVVSLTADAFSQLATPAISDTPEASAVVDVFIYDTSKDTDGGQWRFRTDHTSWYNETLNATYRGATKEFPAVALIVAEADTVTIYDMTDSAVPMWMVFRNASTRMLGGNSTVITSATMLNGLMVVGQGVTYDVHGIDFLADNSWRRGTGSISGWFLGTIADRDLSNNFVSDPSLGVIIDRAVNDVAMTVLPNAPIDSETGLQIPTIYAFTDGGVSRIADDGTVTSTATSGAVYGGGISGDYVYGYTTSAAKSWLAGYLAESDLPTGGSNHLGAFWGYVASTAFSAGNYIATPLLLSGNAVGRGGMAGSLGINIFSHNPDDRSKSMGAAITSDYTSGWMQGDIKGAWLADTDDTDLVGTELVTNGDFATDTDWTKGTGWTIAAGVGSSDGTQTANSLLQMDTALTLVIGETYTASYEVTAYSSGNLTFKLTGDDHVGTPSVAVGLYSETFVPTSTNRSMFLAANSTFVGSVDNVTIRLADPDRSVNANGLAVNGTITKTAVATGAELMAYSGFSASNYLEQPYNADLDFGTGDFYVMGWVSGADVSDWLVDTVDAGNTEGIALYVDASGFVVIRTRNANNSDTAGTIDVTADGYCFVAVTRTSTGTVQSVYINGVLDVSATVVARSIGGTNSPMRIGATNSGVNPLTGSLALLRIGAGAPSAEQIKETYESERWLFQDNAACTLDGASDAVLALGYDESTDLLHASTSTHRSLFKGLQRVDSVAETSTTSISAVNGAIANGS